MWAACVDPGRAVIHATTASLSHLLQLPYASRRLSLHNALLRLRSKNNKPSVLETYLGYRCIQFVLLMDNVIDIVRPFSAMTDDHRPVNRHRNPQLNQSA
jgi:hypothetical protein